MYPTDRRYTNDHEWVLVEGDSCKIGITEFAQNELGDIVYVELPEQDKEFKAGDVLGTIESVKAVSEIFAPVGGTVVAANDGLTDNPEKIVDQAHGAGWYCTLRFSDSAEVDALMEAAAYEKHIG